MEKKQEARLVDRKSRSVDKLKSGICGAKFTAWEFHGWA